MTKKIILLSLFVINILHSQSNLLKVEYNEQTKYSNSFVFNYSAELYVSKDYSFYKTNYNDKEEKNGGDNTILLNEENDNFSEIITDKKKKILKEYTHENIFLKKFYSVSENMPNFKWKYLKGEKSINKFKCKQATTTFRGRTYTVWYTEEIPVSAGPWKFSGLPGLILDVADKDGLYNWTVKNISYPYKGKVINFKNIFDEKKKFKEISYKDFDAKKINAIKDKIDMFKSKTNSRGKSTKYEYNTLQEREVINEWRTQTHFK